MVFASSTGRPAGTLQPTGARPRIPENDALPYPTMGTPHDERFEVRARGVALPVRDDEQIDPVAQKRNQLRLEVEDSDEAHLLLQALLFDPLPQ